MQLLPPQLPRVSVLTPTYNRQIFLPQLVRCLMAQDYPHELLEWVVVDASEVPVELDCPFLRYFRAEVVGPQPIGVMRNQAIKHATGDVMVNMDDDDYYYPSWVSHAVSGVWDTGLAGVTWRYLLDLTNGRIYKSGPYRKYLAPSCKTAFTREYSNKYQYGVSGTGRHSDEELKFTRGHHNPLTVLDQAKSGVGIMHRTNACNTRRGDKPVMAMTMEELILDEPSRAFYREMQEFLT